MKKSGNNCLKTFFSWDENSCYIDSLFVALFHSENILINKFVENLKVNEYLDNRFILDEDKKNIKTYGEIVSNGIKNIYREIILLPDKNQKLQCINIRASLNNHYLIFKDDLDPFHFNTDNDNFVNTHNHPITLLNYLYTHLFDNDSFKNVTIYRWNYEDYNNNNYNTINNFRNNTNGIEPNYNDINFINLRHNITIDSTVSNYILKDKLNDLFLHSIIADINGHYICYYKCENVWYLYNDLGISKKNNNYTVYIGSLTDVIKDYDRIIVKRRKKGLIQIQIDKSRTLELILLYLRDNTQQQEAAPAPAPVALAAPAVPLITNMDMDINSNIHNIIGLKNQSIIQLKKLIDNHFDELKDLITLLK
jgi:hypothetical protein